MFFLSFFSYFFRLKVGLEGDTAYRKAVRLSGAVVARVDVTTVEAEVVSVSSRAARLRPIVAAAAAKAHTSTGRVMVAGTEKTHRIPSKYIKSQRSISTIVYNLSNNPSLK